MARKTPRTPPPVPQGDAESEAPGIASQLKALDRYDAEQRAQDADEVLELQRAWAPQLTQAKAILAELSALQAQHGPTVEALGNRDFSRLPPTARTFNTIAQIERACLELQHQFTHTAEDLRRIIAAIEGLSERTVALLHANATTYRELLGFYKHAPQGVRDLFHRLEHLVSGLTEGIELEPSAEPTTAVRRPSQPTAPTIEVEMA